MQDSTVLGSSGLGGIVSMRTVVSGLEGFPLQGRLDRPGGLRLASLFLMAFPICQMRLAARVSIWICTNKNRQQGQGLESRSRATSTRLALGNPPKDNTEAEDWFRCHSFKTLTRGYQKAKPRSDSA